MITIIRYRNDTYYGLEGKIEHPSISYSGYIQEDYEFEKKYFNQLKEFEENRKNMTYLNKVHVKKALDLEIPEWKEKFIEEREDIEYKLNHIQGFSGFDQLWKTKYTFYYLNKSSIDDLTKPTELTNTRNLVQSLT